MTTPFGHPWETTSAARRSGAWLTSSGCSGILAPAATGFGETLALFEQHLPSSELPTLIREERWDTLPADPRRLRVVDDTSGEAS
jgi:hypothetical protein